MATQENNNKWKWNDTALRYVISAQNQDLTTADLKTLTKIRSGKTPTESTKAHLQLKLMDSYDVELKKPLNKLTVKQLKVELKLRNLDTNTKDKKATLVQKLNVKYYSKS